MKYLFEYFLQFRKLVGRKIYLLLTIMLVVGFVEGVGMTLFLPILQNGFGDDKISLALKAIFKFLHITYSFTLILGFILVFFILRMVFLLLYARYYGRLSSGLVVALRKKALDRIFAADYLYLLKKEVGYLNNAIIREIAYVVDAFDKFSAIVNYLIFGIIYAALSLLLSIKATVSVVILGMVLLIFMRKLNALTSQASISLSSSHGKFNSVLIQSLSKLKYLKATLTNIKVSKIIDEKINKLGSLQFKLFFLQSLSKDAFEPFVVLVVVSLFFYYVVALKRNVNEVIFLIFLFLQLARQFLNAQGSYRKFLMTTGSIRTFNNIIRELDANREDLHSGGAAPDFDREINFKDVTVVFPNGKKALDGINISIKPRSVVAFVGHSGSGKSTIANMITGILKPTHGEVAFGGIGYDRLNLKALRENIGYVTQEDIIFSASIKENISLWDENFSRDKLDKVIEMAHIKNFVSDISQKENAMLGDNGLDISGGQRQRITIARELYKEAKLLILDEATSSLDTKSEKQIYENLKEFKGQKTLVVIAHRLSTIKNADYIYVMDGGKVVEEGTYEDLYDKKGEFKTMVEEQKLV